MSKTETLSGKNTRARNLLAGSLIRARNLDKKDSSKYRDGADLYEYLMRLGGLSNYLDYVRSLGGERLVLDIGAGKTKAVAQLENNPMGKDLEFRATVLTRQASINDNLGFDKVIFTPVEELKGIYDETISGIIATNSISYSIIPELAVNSIDRILVPGGAIKATFKFPYSGSGEEPLIRSYRKTHDEFSSLFRDLGYDVALSERFQVVMLAIKPGGVNGLHVNAEDLIDVDSGTEDVKNFISPAK